MNTITTVAHPNIALIKYWGKRDEQLHLPTRSSISLTLEAFVTETTITSSSDESDHIIVNNSQAPDRIASPIITFINYCKNKYALSTPITIQTSNNFPTAAGLASSASGFAALAAALNVFFSLKLSPQELSILARQGSGSAARSVTGGFSMWHKGMLPDGSDSYAEQLFTQTHWPELRVIIAITQQDIKTQSSRHAMQQTIETSPDYAAWIETSEDRIAAMRNALITKNLPLLGELAEQDSLDMHQTMHTSKPPINFFVPATYRIMRTIKEIRTKQTIPCYFTIDAGPNVKILCLDEHVPALLKALNDIEGVLYCITSTIGPAVHTKDKEIHSV